MAYITLENVTLRYPTTLKRPAGKSADTNLDVAGDLVTNDVGTVSVNALENVSLKLKDGDRLGIIGSNGSGKTTLLRTMAGLFTPDEGRVSLEGRIATMFSLGLGMQLEATGLRNVYLSGIVAGATRKQIDQILPEIKAFTGLGDYLHMPLRTYSQGMAMRLKFACATAFQPDIVLLDEWIGAGDSEFQGKAEARLGTMLDQSGIVVLATHNIRLMQSIATQVLWLEKGRVRMLGPTQEVLDKRSAERRSFQGAPKKSPPPR